MNPNENEPNADAAETAGETVQVNCRFMREELDTMKADTGATADATAVACFVRKNLRRG